MFQDPLPPWLCGSAGRYDSMRSVTESSADKTDILLPVAAAAPRGAAGPRGAAAPKPAPTWLALWWGAMLSSRTADRRSTAPTDRRSMGGAALAGLRELRERMRGLCERGIALVGRGVGALGGVTGARWPSSGAGASPWPGSKAYWASA